MITQEHNSVKAKSPKIKKRNWTFVCYPESLPSDWVDIIERSGIPCAFSPLHDKDINEATKEPKKPHFHVILCYDGPTTYSAVKAFTDSLNATIPQPIESLKGVYRYLTHKDNPEKAQYSENDIVCCNGFNARDFIELTKSEVLTIKKEILELIRSAEIYEYSDLINTLLDSDMTDHLDVASSHTILFNTYISSRRNKHGKQPQQQSGGEPF